MSAILIVDDHEQNRYLLRTMLAASGDEVLEAANGAEALELARRARPDLIISDILMPQMDGFALCRECKRDEQLRDIPFIFYTATYTDPRDEALAMQLGAARFIVKPVENEDFQAILREVLQARAAGKLTATTPPLKEETAFYRLYNEALIRKLEEKMLDLDRLNRSLAESEKRYRRLAENARDIIYSYEFTPKRGFIYVSPAATSIVGYTPEEHYADPDLIYKMIHPGDRPILEAVNRGEGSPNELFTMRWVRKDGQVIWVEQRNAPVFNEAGELIAIEGIARDITERVQAVAALEESQRRLQGLFDNTQDAILLMDDEARCVDANPAACGLLGYNREELRQLNMWDITHPSNRELGQEQWRAFIAAGRLAGEYTLRRKDGTTVEAEYRAAANILPGVHLSSMRDITERKQHEREREAIILMANALRTAPTRADMLPVILDKLMEILHAEGAALVMRDPATGEILVELARGEFMRDLRVRMPPGEGVSGYVIATGQPFISNDIRSEPRFTRPELLEKMRAAACVPLIAQGQTIGALWLGRQNEITPGEVGLLSAVADMAANAIHRATLHEQTQRQVNRLAALHSIDAAIGSSMNLNVTLNILLGHVTDQLGVDAAVVLLLNQKKQMLEFGAGRGFHSSAIERSQVLLGEGSAGAAARERRVVKVPDLSDPNAGFSRASLLAGERFVAYYGAPLISKGQVKGMLELFHRAPINPDPDWLAFLETLAGQAAIAIDDAELFEGLQRSNTDLSIAYDATIEGWSRALDLRDRETEGHTLRVTEFTVQLARAAGMAEKDLVHLYRGVLLHDIGKMGVPDNILLKPGPLTDDEWVIMRRHPQLAYEMLSPILYLKPALDIPYCHHEKWDGTGYPRGLKGEAIPLAARLFAVVDVWDALRSNRPYRAAWPEEKVLKYIKDASGKHFDPQAVEQFLVELSKK